MTVTLNGSGTDADGDVLTYSWTQVGVTPTVALTNPRRCGHLQGDLHGAGWVADGCCADVQFDGNRGRSLAHGRCNHHHYGEPSAGCRGRGSANGVRRRDGNLDRQRHGCGWRCSDLSEPPSWTQVGVTPTVALTNADTSMATFTAPDGLLTDAVLTFSLTVTDGRNAASEPDTVVVTVTAAPTADAGADQTVSEGVSVTLTGRGAGSPHPLTYSWTQVGVTPTVALTNAGTSTATFTAPDGLLTDAVLTFSLTVTAGGVSHTDDVIITITANQAPVAEAGDPQTVSEGVTVTLNGSGADADGDVLTYSWTQVGVTPTVALTNADTSRATFTAPDGLLTDAVLTFSLTVTAGGVSHTDDVIITITANQAPVAEAGDPQTVSEGVTVTLNGSGADADGDVLTYSWTQVGVTPTVALTNAGTSTATFTAPAQLLTDAVLTFSLTVTAGGVSHTDDVIITITANQAPVAEAGDPQTVSEGVTVTLNGSGTDADGDVLTYSWTQVGVTLTVALTNADTSSATFTGAGWVADGCCADVQFDGNRRRSLAHGRCNHHHYGEPSAGCRGRGSANGIRRRDGNLDR